MYASVFVGSIWRIVGVVLYDMVWFGLVCDVFPIQHIGGVFVDFLLAVLVGPFLLLLFSRSSGRVTSFLDTWPHIKS